MKEHDAERVVDVGTGSGAIAVTLAVERPSLQVRAIDISPDALAVARQNAECLGAVAIEFLEGDLLQPLLPNVSWLPDAVVANLPYIAAEEVDRLMPEVREYEPHLALCAGADELTLITRLIAESAQVLRPGGLLALELGINQAKAVSALLVHHGWGEPRIVSDYAGIERHILAELPK